MIRQVSYRKSKLSCFILLICSLCVITFQGFIVTNALYYVLAPVCICAAFLLNPIKKKTLIIIIGLCAVLLGSIYLNGIVAAIRSSLSYFLLLAGFILVDFFDFERPLEKNTYRINKTILAIYSVAIFQVLLYLIAVSLNPSYKFIISGDVFMRESLGWMPLTAYFLALIVKKQKLTVGFELSLVTLFFLIVVPTLVLLNSSRTELLLLVLLTGIGLSLGKYSLARSFVLVLLGCSLVFTLLSFGFSNDRLEIVSSEIFKTSDFNRIEDIYWNYRAYENLVLVNKTVENFATGNIFGCGFGCPVSFGTTLELDNIEYEQVSQFHNGILGIVLHIGVVGFGVLFFLFRSLFRSFKYLQFCIVKGYMQQTVVAVLIFCPLFSLLASSYTSGGFLSSRDILNNIIPWILVAWIRTPSRTTFIERQG